MENIINKGFLDSVTNKNSFHLKPTTGTGTTTTGTSDEPNTKRMKTVDATALQKIRKEIQDFDNSLSNIITIDDKNAFSISRDLYSRMYGPTTGDIVRLADTELYIQVEEDKTVYGDECKFGGGKVLREGMGQATGLLAKDQLDTVITNALIVDYTGRI